MPKSEKLDAIANDVYEDECPTLVARFDVDAYAKATATWEEDHDAQDDFHSGIRRSFPTLTQEVGQLPNEPEEDAIFRTIGGATRVLVSGATEDQLASKNLDALHAAVFLLVDGVRSISAVLAASPLPRLQTLRALEELLMVGIVT